MKALTVRPPWAWAIAVGAKPVENRTWSTRHRGQVAVHAAARSDLGADDGLPDLVWDAYRDRFPLPPKWPTPEQAAEYDARWAGPAGVAWKTRSAVLAVADLTGICAESVNAAGPCDCGPWAVPGRWHWQLADVRLLLRPVPAVGRLGLFDLLPEVEAAVWAQLPVVAS